MKLKEMSRGSVFTYCGASWVLLSPGEKCLCLSVDVYGEEVFGDENGQNWLESNLKSYMNETLIGKFEGAEFLDMEVDLTARDGSTDFGKDTCKLAPLTKGQYDTYKRDAADEEWVIPLVSRKYWLVTPGSSDEPFIGDRNAHFVRIVCPDGSDEGIDPDMEAAARPACMLSGELEV